MTSWLIWRMSDSRIFRCPGRCRRGWGASVAKSLLSNHAVTLLPTLCLLVVPLYALGDKLRHFVAGIFIPQYHYPFSVALCFGQVLVSILFLNLLHAVDLVRLQPYSRSLGEKVLVSALCQCTHDVLAMWAEASGSSVGLYRLSLPLLPVITKCLSLCLKVASPLSVHITVLISILSSTSFVITAAVSQGLEETEPLEYLYAPVALLLHGLSLTWLAKVSEAERQQPADFQASVCDIYYAQLVNQGWMLGLLWLLHPDGPWLVLKRSSWQSLLFHGYLLAILLLGMVLNFLVGMSALGLSPLAAAMLHSARHVVQPFFRHM